MSPGSWPVGYTTRASRPESPLLPKMRENLRLPLVKVAGTVYPQLLRRRPENLRKIASPDCTAKLGGIESVGVMDKSRGRFWQLGPRLRVIEPV